MNSGRIGAEASGGGVPVCDAMHAPGIVTRFIKIKDALADPHLAAEWRALTANAAQPNPFAERWYMEAALHVLGKADVRLAVVHDAGLIGLMPFVWQKSYAGLPLAHVQNWLNHNAFLGTPLVRKGHEQAFWAGLLEALDQAAGNALFLHLSGLDCDGPLSSALALACAENGRHYARVHSEERALLEQGLSSAAYLEAHMRGKKRKELRRQQNRLSELGTLAFERSDGAVQLEDWIDAFLALERRGWKGANGSALDCADGTRNLFRSALHGAAGEGKLELLTLRLDGRAIAMLATFLTPPGGFSFKTAFDEDYARYSPGVLLQIHNLALLDREGIAWCDSCAAQDHPMIDSIWAGRRPIGRYSVAIGGRGKRMVFSALLMAEKAKSHLRRMNSGKIDKIKEISP